MMSFVGVCFSREYLVLCFVLCFILCRVGQFGVVPGVRWAAFKQRYLRRDAFLVSVRGLGDVLLAGFVEGFRDLLLLSFVL